MDWSTQCEERIVGLGVEGDGDEIDGVELTRDNGMIVDHDELMDQVRPWLNRKAS